MVNSLRIDSRQPLQIQVAQCGNMINKRLVAGSKRDVVDGQFEDPDESHSKRYCPDSAVERVRNNATSKGRVVAPGPFLVPVADRAIAAPIPASACVATGSQQVPMMVMANPPVQWPPHPQNGCSQQPVNGMFLMVAPPQAHLMQHHGQISHQQMTSLMIPMPTPNVRPPLPPAEKETQWRIPYSHNYHPVTGFINPPKQASESNSEPDKTSKAASDAVQPSTPAQEPPADLPSLPDSTLSQASKNFPAIKEDVEKAFGISDDELTNQDVLCGRGGLTNTHPGNVRYREIVDQYRWHYGTVKKSSKSAVARVIVTKVRESHGRFLKKDGGCWYEIGDELALQKTSQTLREGLAKIYRDGLKAKMTTK